MRCVFPFKKVSEERKARQDKKVLTVKYFGLLGLKNGIGFKQKMSPEINGPKLKKCVF